MTTLHTSASGQRVAAVILAGGEGARLGGAIKANIEVGGKRLLWRVAEKLVPSASPVLVAHGRTPPAALELGPRLTPIADLDVELRGPLAGLVAAIAHLKATDPGIAFIVSAAVDTPFLPLD